MSDGHCTLNPKRTCNFHSLDQPIPSISVNTSSILLLLRPEGLGESLLPVSHMPWQPFNQSCWLYLQNRSRTRPRVSTPTASILDPKSVRSHVAQGHSPTSTQDLPSSPHPPPQVTNNTVARGILFNVRQITSLLYSKPSNVPHPSHRKSQSSPVACQDLHPPPPGPPPAVAGPSLVSEQVKVALSQNLCPCSSPCLVVLSPDVGMACSLPFFRSLFQGHFSVPWQPLLPFIQPYFPPEPSLPELCHTHTGLALVISPTRT